jgi:rod shape-determining protein MreD
VKISRELFLVMAVFFLQHLTGVADWGVDLPLIFVVLKALRTTPVKGAAWGFFMGTLQDLFTANWIGTHIAADALVGYLASLSRRHVYRERVLTQTFLIFGMMALRQLLVWGLLKWDGTAPLAGDALGVVAHSVAMTGLVGWAACWLVVRFRPRRQDPATA